MPYAFKVRNWETIFYSNIDILDSLASSVRLHIYSNKIIRILPLLDENINEEWITNKARFSYDALLLNRLNYPKINFLKKFIVFSWDFSINYVFKWINRKNNIIYSIIGPFVDVITSISLKNFFNIIGISSILSYFKFKWTWDFKFFYLLNNILESFEIIRFFLFISCDLRLESPLLNIRIKKNYNANKNNELFLYSYGLSTINLNYPIKNLGSNIIKFLKFLKGKCVHFLIFFLKCFFTFSYYKFNYKLYNKPIFFLGHSILIGKILLVFYIALYYFFKNKFNWIIFNLIINNLGFLSYSSVIYNNYNNIKKKLSNGLLYNISSEKIPLDYIDKFTFIIYQGFIKNNSDIYSNADIILPSTAPYEMDGLYINLEGRYRFMKKHIKNFLTIYTDWEIINLLKIFNKKKIFWNIFFFKKYSHFKFFYKI